MMNFEYDRLFKYSKKNKIIQYLYQNIVISKPDKGNCDVFIDNQDYISLVEHIFKVHDKDPATNRMRTQ